MKWYLHWFEGLDDEYESKLEKEQWANSWEETVGYFTNWISKSSNVTKGEVICYWGDTPYGDGKPCLTFNVYIDGGDEE